MSLRQLASVPRTEEEEKLEAYRKRMQIRKIWMYVGPDQLVTFVRFSQSAVDCLRDLLRERCREPKA